jgi:hypothetical protein
VYDDRGGKGEHTAMMDVETAMPAPKPAMQLYS